MLLGTHSINNLIQNEEFLLELTKTLRQELDSLDHARDEVKNQQKEAQKQGTMVKKNDQLYERRISKIGI